jgi:carboxymethylenebutenolidase
MRSILRTALLMSALVPLGTPLHAQSAADHAHLAAMSREHAHERPVASGAATVAPRQEVVGRMVEYGRVGSQPARGFLARPARPPRGQALPAVLLIHEWWGLNDNMRDMARRLAGEGYQVLALDMYGGRVATTPEEARQHMGEIIANSGRGAEHIRAATEYLTRQRAPRVGVVGWCFGGGWALQAALLENQRVHATVMYYGRPISDPGLLEPLRAPVLGHFGSADRGIQLATVQHMEATMRQLGKDVTIHVYDGAGHGFANPSGETYRQEAADQAWSRTTEFLGRHLRAVPQATAGP